MGSVKEEITRLETAKKDIETAIETCGVNVPDTELIDTYASYIRQIPSAVFSGLNVDPVGGADQFIQSIKQTNGLIEATVGGLVSTSNSGLVPKADGSAGIINNQSDDYVLTYKGGTIDWYKLPANAFKNDDNNTTYTLSGALNGNAYDVTLTPSSGTNTGAKVPAMGAASSSAAGTAGLVPAPAKNQHNSFLRGDGTWVVPDNTTYSVMTGATASAAGKSGLVPQPAKGDQGKFLSGAGTWTSLPSLSITDSESGNAVTDVEVSGHGITLKRGTTFSVNGHKHSSDDITALTSYIKATTAAAIASTDSLNSALGKLELKADTAYNLVKGAYDGDGTIENLAEILKVLEGISDTDTIQAIVGKYLPLAGGMMSGNITFDTNRMIRWHQSDSYSISCPTGGDGAYLLLKAHNGITAKKRLSVYTNAESLPNTNYNLYTDGSLYAASAVFGGNTKITNGSDLTLQASSGAQGDAGDIVFSDYSGAELGRIWLDSTASQALSLRYGANDAVKRILHSGNSSVSKSGQTLTVKINGVEQSITNSTYSTLPNPYNISFKDTSNNTVTYNGSSALDLTGGIYYAVNASKASTLDCFTRRATANCTWGTLTASNGYTPIYWGDSAAGGGIGFSDKGGQTFMQIDGDYYAQEGAYKVWHAGNLTKVSQLTNDSGYLTSLPSHNHDGRYAWGNYASQSDLSDCNSVSSTGFWTHSGFTHRPDGVENWGSLMNIRLYSSNNNYHRQLFFDCYGSDKIWTRSDNGGSWTSWKRLALVSDIPTSLKSPGTLTLSAGTFSAKTYDGSANVTVNIPTHTSHLTNNSSFMTETDVNNKISNFITRNVNTSTNTNPFIVSRAGGTIEALKIGVDDGTAHFVHEQDETVSDFLFKGKWNDTESGGGAKAGEKTIRFGLSSSDHNIYVGSSTVLHSGNYNSYAPKLDGTGATGTWRINISGNADTVDSLHESDLVKFYLSPMDSGASASSAKSWFKDTMPAASGAIVYNVPGSEKTIIAGKSSGACGHMLQLNYDDTYLRILRYAAGTWKSTDWEKISAGYADSASYLHYANVGGGYSDTHDSVLKAYFNSKKSSIPRNSLLGMYSGAYGNGSYYMGYFLSGYDTAPYGGFFVAHYINPYYVGIANGTYTTQAILTSTNYTNYTVQKDGTGATGTWGINISGIAASASSVAWGNVSGKPSTFTPSTHTHTSIVTEGDNRAVATKPTDYSNSISFRGLKNNSTIGIPTTNGTYSYLVGLKGWTDKSGGGTHELAFNDGGIFRRSSTTSADTWGSWLKLLDSSNYTDYTVKKDGTGATGTWGINITGSATDSDKLDGIDSTGFLKYVTQNATFSSVANISTDLAPGIHRIHISGVEYSSILTGKDFNGSYWQLYFHPSSGYTQDIKYRATNCTTWKTLLDSNNWSSFITIPSVGNGTVTINQGGTSKGSFTLNQSTAATINLTDYYPTAFSWTGGTTAGPTGSLTGTGMSPVSFGAIPSASASASGIVTTAAQSFAGVKTFTGKVELIGGGSGSMSITYDKAALVIGTMSRAGSTDEYYPGIAFNHMYGYAGGSSYRNHAHAWIGLRLESTSGSELSSLIFATQSTTTTGTALTERMCITSEGTVGIGAIAPNTAYKLYVNGHIYGSKLYSTYIQDIHTSYLPFLVGRVYKAPGGSAAYVRSGMTGLTISQSKNRIGRYVMTITNNTGKTVYIHTPMVIPVFGDWGSGSCYESPFAYLDHNYTYIFPTSIATGKTLQFAVICGKIHTQGSWSSGDFTKSNDDGGFSVCVYGSWYY